MEKLFVLNVKRRRKMKIRNGFVSNSSSTSFCIYAAEITQDEFDALDTQEFGQKMKELGLRDWCSNPDRGDNEVFIGRSWDSVKDDETGKQFKESIQKSVKELLGKDKLEFFSHEDSWYNG